MGNGLSPQQQPLLRTFWKGTENRAGTAMVISLRGDAPKSPRRLLLLGLDLTKYNLSCIPAPWNRKAARALGTSVSMAVGLRRGSGGPSPTQQGCGDQSSTHTQRKTRTDALTEKRLRLSNTSKRRRRIDSPQNEDTCLPETTTEQQSNQQRELN